jgi:hypothetical protein
MDMRAYPEIDREKCVPVKRSLTNLVPTGINVEWSLRTKSRGEYFGFKRRSNSMGKQYKIRSFVI